MPPALVHYATEEEYFRHYEKRYCQATITTFDGIRVFFPRQQFQDAFYESADRHVRDKTLFSRQRAERIEWIGAALEDAAAELYVGWDRKRKAYHWNRRIALVYGDYVVVIQISADRLKADFITAYVAGASTIAKIRTNPKWK